MLGKYCSVSVSHIIGSADERCGFAYPVNFGYARGKRFDLPEKTGAFILGINHPVREFDGRIIALMKTADGSTALVVAPKSKKYIIHEIEEQLGSLHNYFDYELECYFERSCGAVVFHEIDGIVRYLMIKNKRSAHWSFPKGHIEKGEADEETAIREVLEETNVKIDIIPGFKAKSEYSIHKKIEKTVNIFAATCESTSTKIQPEEIEDYKWLDYNSAMKNLRFDNDRSILYKVRQFLINNNYIKE